MRSYLELALRAPAYFSFRRMGWPEIFPVNYTLSITNQCNSACKTCFIWRLYREKPELKEEELSTNEWLEVISSLGRSPFWITISGGEPFLRKDLVELCRAMCEANSPRIINIPTNGLLPDRVRNWTGKIAEACEENHVSLVINLSIDGIGEEQDAIRGVRGCWSRVLKSLEGLRELKDKHPGLTVGIHTVVSRYNVGRLGEIAKHILEELRPDHYIMEVAEERSELFNVGTGITPTPGELARALNKVIPYLRARIPSSRGVSRISLLFRLEYYGLLPKILASRRQLVPCMALYASCHINPYGDLWPCCILGYEKSVGNLKEHGFDFRRLWRSKEAEEVRKFIREGRCYCPLANAHYTNLLLDPRRVLSIMLRGLLGR